jgi:hypothetical protein
MRHALPALLLAAGLLAGPLAASPAAAAPAGPPADWEAARALAAARGVPVLIDFTTDW